VVLAFFFGYSLTMLPLLRSGLTLATVLPVAIAADTLSITVMEIVDNLIILVIPGAMEAGWGVCSSGEASLSRWPWRSSRPSRSTAGSSPVVKGTPSSTSIMAGTVDANGDFRFQVNA
jgi:Domain of unknown function (DUF4396)